MKQDKFYTEFYTEQKHRETMNSVDMLKGSINRMCVTSELDELERMFIGAVCRLSDLYAVNKRKIIERKYGDEENGA